MLESLSFISLTCRGNIGQKFHTHSIIFFYAARKKHSKTRNSTRTNSNSQYESLIAIAVRLRCHRAYRRGLDVATCSLTSLDGAENFVTRRTTLIANAHADPGTTLGLVPQHTNPGELRGNEMDLFYNKSLKE